MGVASPTSSPRPPPAGSPTRSPRARRRPRREGWPAIARGANVLIQAPTGSGKTLAAFLHAIDRLGTTPAAGTGIRLLYVSPLKALNYDVERNLRGPLAGIRATAERLGLRAARASRVAVRTGDTPARDRAAALRRPPDVLITTPESLYLLLTSPRARETLRGVETVIVDEVHAVAATKRGTHLALSLERLEHLVGRPVQRIALSATQRPLEEIARFVGGDREVEVVDAGTREGARAARSSCPSRTWPRRRRSRSPTSPATRQANRSIWPALYPRLLELVRAHRTTLVFVNNRRLAERLALRLNELAGEEVARAHHGSLAREARVEIEEAAEGRHAALPRRHELARARHRHGRDRPRGAGRVAAQRLARPAARRPRRPHRRRAQPRPHLPQVPRRPGGVRRGRRPHARGPRRVDARPAQPARRAGPADRRDVRGRGVGGRRPRGARPARLPVPRPAARRSSRACSTCSRAATRRTSSPSCARASSGTAWPTSCTGGPTRARWPSPTAARSPTAGSSACTWPTAPAASASSTRRWSTRRASARRSCSAPRRWRIERITRDRVLVSPAPGQPGPDPVLARRGRRPPASSSAAPSARSCARSRRCPRRRALRAAARPPRARRARRREPAALPRRAARRDRRPADRPHDRRRALPRRDRRLAPVHPQPVRRPGARAVGARAERAPARRARRRDAGPVVRRRHHPAPPRRRRPAAGRRRRARPRRGRGPARARAGRLGALRRALPRERRARAADPAPPARASARRCGSSG